MKKIVKFSLAILSLATIASSSFAAVEGSYLGAGLGVSRLRTLNDYLVTGPGARAFTQSRELGGFGARAFGGYNFNRYLGLEAGFSHYANSEYKSNLSSVFHASRKYSMNAFDVVGKAYLPIGETGFNVYGLVGGALVRSNNVVKSSLNLPPTGHFAAFTGKAKESKVTTRLRPKFGVGVSYDIPESKFTTSLELSRIQGTGNVKKNIKAIPNADMLTLNVAYNFD